MTRPRAAVIVLAFGICHLAFVQSPSRSLSLYLLGHRIGAEQYSIDSYGLKAHFEYLDRGTSVALDSSLSFAPDFTPLSFESHGKSYRYFAVDASVPNP